MTIPLLEAGDLLRPLLPVATKLPQSEDDQGIVAHFLGIPVGFQFGTAAGLTGIPALLVDILTDPTTYLLGGLGALTKTGRAAGAAARLLEAGKAVEESANVTEKLIPLAKRAIEAGARSPDEMLQMLRNPLSIAAQTETRSFQNVAQVVSGLDLNGARSALMDIRSGATLAGELRPGAADLNRMLSVLERKGPDALAGHLQGSISAREAIRDSLNTALGSGDWATAKDALKQLSKIAPTQQWKEMFSGRARAAWKEAFAAAKDGTPIGALAEGARAQAEAGQRALLLGKVPFGPEATLIRGAPVLGALSDALGAAGKALGVSRAGAAVEAAAEVAKPLEPLEAAPFTLADTIGQSAEAMGRSAQEALSAGNLSLSGEELLKSRTDLLRAHIDLSQQIGAKVADEYHATMAGMGLATEKDYGLLNDLLQDRDKWLTREKGTAAIEGPYGSTSIYGELNDAAKAAGMTDRHLMVAQAIDSGFRKFGDQAIAQGLLDGLLPDYMDRVVTVLPGKEAEYANAMKKLGAKATETTTFWRHAQERTIPGWDQLMALQKSGIVDVEKDPGKLLQGYVSSFGKVSADAGFMDGMVLSRIPLEMPAKGGGTKDFLLHLMMPGDARFDRFAAYTNKYVRVSNADSPSIMALARQIGERTGTKGYGFTRHIWVHEDIAPQLRAVIEPGFALPSSLPATASGSEKAMAYALQANSVAKRFLLMPGTVHFLNLTEKLLVTNGWEGFRDALSKTLPDMVKGAKARSYLESLPDMEDAIRHGLRLDAPLDAEIDSFQRAMKFVSQKLPITKPVTDAMQWVDRQVSSRLWGQYHAPLKLYSYNELLSRSGTKFAGLEMDALKREIAAHVNASFGGGNLEKFVGSKKGQQLLRLSFLAPDWLIGNTRIATDVFANLFAGKERALLPAGAVLGEDARAFFARQYALRAGLFMVLGGNFANLAFTGHFMHDNEDATRIQLPGTDSTGRPIYLSMFDPFMFPFELAAKPVQFLARKMGPIPRVGIGEITSRDFYGAPIVTTKDGPLSNFAKRVGFAVEQVAPISLQTLAGVQYGRVPIGYRALALAGLPIRGSAANAPEEVKAEAAARVAMQAKIDQAVNGLGEAHALMMKDSAYRRGLDRARSQPLLPVLPNNALLPSGF